MNEALPLTINRSEENPLATPEKSDKSFEVRALVNDFRRALLLASAFLAGCISSVQTGKATVTWLPVGEEMSTANLEPITNLSVQSLGGGVLEIEAKKTCETREIKRTVEQALERKELETKDIGTELAASVPVLVIGGGIATLFGIGASNAKSEKTFKQDVTIAALVGGTAVLISSIMYGEAIVNGLRAIDEEEWQGTRETHTIVSATQRDCSTRVPIALRTSKGVFPLGTTDESGHLRVRLNDVIPQNVLAAVIDETATIESQEQSP